jgi:hypothetical protein
LLSISGPLPLNVSRLRHPFFSFKAAITMTKKTIQLFAAASAAVCFAASAVGQDVIAAFPMAGNSTAASVGGGIASFNFSGTPNFSDVAATTGFTDAINQTGGWGEGSYWELSLDATGFTDISISAWGQRSSGTGPRDFRVEVSYDGGGSFSVIVPDYTVPSTLAGYSNQGIALAAIANNNPEIILRWVNFSNVSVNEGTVASTGTSRFTDFTVTAIPEPSTYAAIVGGLFLGLVLYRRRVR